MTARLALRCLTTRFLAISLLGLGLPVASWADGAGAQPRGHVSAAPPPTVERFDASCADAGSTVGTVASVSGAAFAQAPGEDPRSLACDDVVRACDRVFTSDGAHLALIVDDVFVQIGAASGLTLQSTGADLHLDSGVVRVIDTRSARDAAHFQLVTPQLRVRGLGGDAEARVGIAAGDTRTLLCSFADPVTVSASLGAQSLGDGGCVEVVGTTLAAVGDGSPTLGVEAALECQPEFAGLTERFLPTDVAAPPGADPFPVVSPAGPFGRNACDRPGSGCAAPPSATPPVFRDPNPTGACGFPGGACGVP